MEGTERGTLSAVDINLDDYKHRHLDEWHYGENRGLWTGGYQVIAQTGDEPAVAKVDIDKLFLTRAQLPEFIAWLTAVYEATGENRKAV